jgi:hypothetical protein
VKINAIKTDQGFVLQTDDQVTLCRVHTRYQEYPKARKDSQVILLDPEWKAHPRARWLIHWSKTLLSIDDVRQVLEAVEELTE